jgi:hypothetical protein
MKNIFYNKKGMFFTLITLFLISLFLVAYATFYFIEDRRALNNRISTMNSFVFSLEEDLGRQLYISGYRAIFIMEKRISEKGVPIENVSSLFNEIFYNCSIYGEIQDSFYCLTFEQIKNSMSDMGRKINANISFDINSSAITQDDPWRIRVSVHGQLFIEDNGGLASWNKQGEFYSYVPIEGFEDPIYSLNTGGRVLRKINKTIYSGFVSGINLENLSNHLSERYYKASSSAPSFIDRIEGRNEANENGIESFVSLPELTSQGISAEDKSVIDYIYFSSENPVSYSVLGMPSWFKIDSAHIDSYGVGGLIS